MQRQPGRRPLGAHHVRLLLGRAAGCCSACATAGPWPSQGDPDHPVNRGRLCPKGLSEHHTHRAPRPAHRRPLVDGRPATWDDALDRVVGGFRRPARRARPRVGGGAVDRPARDRGVLRARQAGAPRAWASRHYDGNTTLCMASAVSGYKLSFGTDGPPGCYEDLELADVVVLWGANIADNHPLLAPARARPTSRPTVIVVDPRVTKTAMVADVHLAVRPRGDIALLNGILPVLLDEGLVDLDAVRGARRRARRARSPTSTAWTVERAADGERHRRRRRSATWPASSAGAERCVLAWTMGVNHSVQGTETVTLLNTLGAAHRQHRPARARRRSRSPGSATPWAPGRPGFTASMPGYRAYDDPDGPRRAGRAAGASTRRACPPSGAGPTPTSSTP